MKCDDFELMMAEALGGELSDADRPAFERHLAECAACRTDYESASATISRLRSLPAPELADAGAAHVPAAIPMPRARWGMSVLRYAASIAIAFAAGYGVNGLSRDDDGRNSATRPPFVGAIDQPQLASAESFGAAFAETYQRRPGRSELSRCLTAMFSKQN